MKAFLAKYKVDLYLIGFSLFAFLLLFFVELWFATYGSYWEGRGQLPRGSWFLLLGLSVFAGIPFCAIFIIRLLLMIKKDRAGLSVVRLLLGVGCLFAPPLASTAGLVSAILLSDEPGCVRFLEGFRDRIESACSLEEVRAWAQVFLDSREDKVSEYGSNLKEIPVFINKIDLQNEISQHVHVSINNGIIDLCCAGSALTGHFGLLIGPSDFIREEGFTEYNGQQVYFLNWKPGIYVWYSEN